MIIDEIEERFSRRWIRYAAASATCAMPVNDDASRRKWVEDPEPNGVALSFLQVLDLAGVLPPAPARDEE